MPAHDLPDHGSGAQPDVLRGARVHVRRGLRHRPQRELEATNYFFSIGDQESVLELIYNQDGRTYDLSTGYGQIAVGVDDLDTTLALLREQGIEPAREPYLVREGGSRLTFATRTAATSRPCITDRQRFAPLRALQGVWSGPRGVPAR
jgi:hypothetical protein